MKCPDCKQEMIFVGMTYDLIFKKERAEFYCEKCHTIYVRPKPKRELIKEADA